MRVAGPAGPSLQRRLLWRVIGAVGGLWLLAALAVGLDARHELGELLDAHLAQSAALLIARQTPDADGVLDDTVQLPVAPDLHHYNQRVAFQIWHDGELLLRSANAPVEPLTTLAAGFETRRRDGQEWRLFVARGGAVSGLRYWRCCQSALFRRSVAMASRASARSPSASRSRDPSGHSRNEPAHKIVALTLPLLCPKGAGSGAWS